MNDKKRIFVGIAVDEALNQAIDKFVVGAFRAVQEAPPKWVPRENRHITCVFIGNATDEQIVEVRAALRGVASQTRPFELATECVCYFGKSKNMLWMKLKPEPLFDDLVARIRNELKTIAPFDIEHRPQTPHITLARLAKASTDLPSPPKIDVSLKAPVHRLLLWQSVTGGQHSVYTPLDQFELTLTNS